MDTRHGGGRDPAKPVRAFGRREEQDIEVQGSVELSLKIEHLFDAFLNACDQMSTILHVHQLENG